MKKPVVSIICVTCGEEAELFRCFETLYSSKTKTSFEVIVVDNKHTSRLRSKLQRHFPKVQYVNSGANIGFGPANNLGAQHATGEFFFFLNPDTEVENKTIDILVRFLLAHTKAAIVAPTLFDMDGTAYADQGSATLTPLAAIMSHSLIHKMWPHNPVAEQYWLRGRNLSKPQRVDVVPGTAIMIRRSVFERIGGFDEQFFLYFEESDLCRRVAQLRKEAWILPQSHLKHIWHAATRSPHFQVIYRQSRFKYFRKYYGTSIAVGVEVVLRFGKKTVIDLLRQVLKVEKKNV